MAGGDTDTWAYLKAHMYDGCCTPWPFHFRSGRPSVWDASKGKLVLVSRVVCELVHGPAPIDKPFALHSCNLGHLGCFNAGCLRWGDQQDNMQDRVKAETLAGERNGGGGKLTDTDIRRIRALRSEHSVTALGRMFGVDSTMISRICRRIAWSHVQ